MTGRSWPNDQTSISSKPSSSLHSSGKNVLNLLVRREICPKTKYVPKRQWQATAKSHDDSSSRSEAGRDAKCGLISWVEAESLRHLSAKYCPLVPPPRSTIAAAFSPDGRTLASTHGDHTVKIIDCQTGNCLKVLTGHRRTPWVVRFHPSHPEILASGSLDHEVCLWDANTSDCIGSRDFYRPIASIAFHAEGDLLAVASGHKLYVWHYNKRGEASSPSIILKTRRSLRAVHFHPHGAPFLLTAEVNNLDSSDSSMTRATSLGYLQYPPPAVFVANVDPTDRQSSEADKSLMSLSFLLLPPFAIDNSRIYLQHATRDVASSSMQVDPSTATTQLQTDANATEHNNHTLCPMDTSPSVPSGSYSVYEDSVDTYRQDRVRNSAYIPETDPMETNEMYPVMGSQPMYASNLTNSTVTRMESHGIFGQIPSRPELVDLGQLHRILACRESLELPVTEGWSVGQNQHGLASRLPSDGSYENFPRHASSSTGRSQMSTHIAEAAAVTGGVPGGFSLSGVPGGSSLSHQLSHYQMVGTDSGELSAHINNPHNEGGTQPIISRIHSELATSLSAAAAAELPCTVKLRVWSHDIKNPSAPLNVERCRLTIPHAVLCSEMGAHFSPCGRFLAACVACVLPNMETDPGLQTLAHQDSGAATSPTRHPISAHQVIYELRIYSLEEATFGSVLVSRAIRAAHCLTSIQFSPTSEHILLAYGRRHGSLLKSIVIDGETTLPIYTVLEVYRVSDMELVRVLPSAEDEVNVACFHPFAGGGLVYGTKEGKLRVLQYDGAHGLNCTAPNFFPDENVTEVEPKALVRLRSTGQLGVEDRKTRVQIIGYKFQQALSSCEFWFWLSPLFDR